MHWTVSLGACTLHILVACAALTRGENRAGAGDRELFERQALFNLVLAGPAGAFTVLYLLPTPPLQPVSLGAGGLDVLILLLALELGLGGFHHLCHCIPLLARMHARHEEALVPRPLVAFYGAPAEATLWTALAAALIALAAGSLALGAAGVVVGTWVLVAAHDGSRRGCVGADRVAVATSHHGLHHAARSGRLWAPCGGRVNFGLLGWYDRLARTRAVWRPACGDLGSFEVIS